jgi:hypothetical protein
MWSTTRCGERSLILPGSEKGTLGRRELLKESWRWRDAAEPAKPERSTATEIMSSEAFAPVPQHQD